MDEEGKLLLDIPLGRSLVEKLAKEKTATVLSAETKRKRVHPPKVYSLADIQAEANRLYGFTAEETLAGCQALYEKHKVTSYPRTDSSYLPESQHAEAPGVLAAIAKTFPATARAVEKANPNLKSPVFNDKKVTAHHGIVPVAHTVDWSQLTDREQKLYRLIAKRYIAQFFPVHEYDETVVKLALGDETFAARGRVVVVKGWKALYQKVEKSVPEKRSAKKSKGDDPEPEDEDAAQTLPVLQKGDVVDVLSVDGREDQTKPPAYFTEGTLIAAMETIWKSFDDPQLQEKLKEAGGIGTPATRSVIIQELKRKKYLETEGKKLHCTEEGRKVLLTASPKVRSAVIDGAVRGEAAGNRARHDDARRVRRGVRGLHSRGVGRSDGKAGRRQNRPEDGRRAGMRFGSVDRLTARTERNGRRGPSSAGFAFGQGRNGRTLFDSDLPQPFVPA